MKGGDLCQLVSNTLGQNPNVNEAEIATKVRVRTTRSALEDRAIKPTLNDLKAITDFSFFNHTNRRR
jgi:hypothetical protein